MLYFFSLSSIRLLRCVLETHFTKEMEGKGKKVKNTRVLETFLGEKKENERK